LKDKDTPTLLKARLSSRLDEQAIYVLLVVVFQSCKFLYLDFETSKK
jgi:hypothetical protein